MKNRQYVPVMIALLVLCSMASLYGCGTAASSGGGSTGGNWIYVGASDDRAISIINGSNNTLAGTIELAPRIPYHIAASPDGKHLYVSTSSVEIVVIDTATNTISGLITTDAVTLSYGMAVTANGALLYFTRCNDNKLVRAYLKSNPITYETVSTAAQPLGMALANDDENCIVGENSNIEFFENAGFTADTSIPVSGYSLYSVAVKNGSAYLPRYTTGGDSLIVDATNEVLLGLITPESASNLFGVLSIPGTNKLYVSQFLSAGELSIVDTTSTPTFEGTVVSGESFTMAYPTYMAATADGKRVYVYDFAISHFQVCVVDTATDKVVKTIPVNSGKNFYNNPVIIYK